MRKLKYLLILLPIFTIAQVGVNTTTPNAMLDIQSTNNGVLIPRVQLTDALDIVTVVNPAGGVLAKSTLVYNINTSGVAPDNVTDGFYYWNGVRWMPIAGNATSDHDWYEVGATTSPDAITDEMFHTGKVAIGKNTADATLDVETNNEGIGINNVLNKDTNTGAALGIDTVLNGLTDDPSIAIRNTFYGTGLGNKTGILNFADATVQGNKYGQLNILSDNSIINSNSLAGVSNTLTSDGIGSNSGITNLQYGSNTATGVFYGMNTHIQNDGSSPSTGVNNLLDSFSSGSGGSFGIFNTISGYKTGGKIGVSNQITSDVADSLIGISNNITSTVDTGSITGIYNVLNANSATPLYGNSNQLGGTGNSNVSAVYSFITNSGDGEHIGIFSNFTGTGTGRKYGTNSTIEATAGGQHFGVFARVLKPGNNYAGYFNGKVAIGTNLSFGIDDYTFPPSRGTNGQIMQTDGVGNVTWQNPGSVISNTSWSINGNSLITNPTNPAIYGTSTLVAGENFLGTTSANDVTFATNTIERMRVKNTTGNVGIGTASPLQPLHVYKNSNTSKSTIFGESIQTSTTTDFQNRGILGYGSGTSASGGFGYGIGVMGIGDRANSYYATGVYAHLGTTAPNAPSTNQALIANGNNLGNAALFTGGNVGIGIPIGTNPSNQLHINSVTNGAVRIVDGTEGNKKVLTSDATGVATWQPVGIESIQANLSAVTGITISYTDTVNFQQTGASITLPPGRYAVNVTMLLSTVPGAYTNSNEAFWVRSSFSDSAGPLPLQSGNIIGSNLISGNLVPSTLYSLLTGMVVINNNTSGDKTYYYIAGRVVTNNSTRSIAFFGGSYWAEDNIIAYRLN